MDPWRILGVNRTNNAKEIKRAYAAKLKITKPDEKPAEFKILHQAYKMAISIASQNNEPQKEALIDNFFQDTADKSQPEKDLNNAPGCIEKNENINFTNKYKKNTGEIPPPESIELLLDYEKQNRLNNHNLIVEKVSYILQSGHFSSEISAWIFLTDTPYILEDEFNWNLGKAIFLLLSEHYKKRSIHQAPDLPFSVVQYLDQLFSWENNAQHLSMEFGDEICDHIFLKLEECSFVDDPRRGVRGGTLIRGKSMQQPRPILYNEETKRYHVGTIFRILIMVIVVIFYSKKLFLPDFSFFSGNDSSHTSKNNSANYISVISLNPNEGTVLTEDSIIFVKLRYNINNFSPNSYTITPQFNTETKNLTIGPTAFTKANYTTSKTGVIQLEISVKDILSVKKYKISRPFIFRFYLNKMITENRSEVIGKTADYEFR